MADAATTTAKPNAVLRKALDTNGAYGLRGGRWCQGDSNGDHGGIEHTAMPTISNRIFQGLLESFATPFRRESFSPRGFLPGGEKVAKPDEGASTGIFHEDI